MISKSRLLVLTCALLATTVATAACAQNRLPVIPPAQYDAEQQQAADAFEAERKMKVAGPFEFLLHSPQVMTLARSMGDYLRFNSAIGNTMSELVILLVAREWSQDFEWWYHLPIAIKAGISKQTADAIADGRRPDGMNADEAMIYDYTTELLKNKQVSGPSFERVQQRFGGKGVVDLNGIAGYYTFLAMQMNATQYRIPNGQVGIKRLPE